MPAAVVCITARASKHAVLYSEPANKHPCGSACKIAVYELWE